MSNFLTSGMRGPAVAELQNLLNNRTPTRLLGLVVDSVFGAKTLARVREFQQQAGLPADGIVGPRTMAALKASAQKPAPPQPGVRKQTCGNCLAGNLALVPNLMQSLVLALQSAAPTVTGRGLAARASAAPPSRELIRRLSAAQADRVRAVYGESIDLTTVFISNKAGLSNRPFTICIERKDAPLSLFPGVGPDVNAVQVMNCGTFEPDDDTLIHEMAHVWQSQHHSNPKQYMKNCVDSQAQAVTLNALTGMQDPKVKRPEKDFPIQFPFSAYAYEPNMVFSAYGGEQVANAIELVDQIVRAHVRGVAKGAVDPDNEGSLSHPKTSDRRKPRVRFDKSDPVDLF